MLECVSSVKERPYHGLVVDLINTGIQFTGQILEYVFKKWIRRGKGLRLTCSTDDQMDD